MTNDYRSKIYERYGSNFQDASGIFDKLGAIRWGRAYDHFLRGWLPERKCARILDLACGQGRLLYFFQNRGYDTVVGIDISPEQVSLASQISGAVQQASALEFLDAHPENFDVIVGLDIVEHLHKPEVWRFLNGCYKALRPNGRLILQTPNADSPWGAVHHYGDFTHEVCFTPTSITRLMRLSGFVGVGSRELGPVPLGYSIASTVRYVIWQVIRFFIMLWNLVETGSKGSEIFTRVFLVTGKRL
jgi:2-polyprenyl-3-methyl-5-hydroxy-6-metoxy-1,4-benzoquinol methylase